MSAEPLTAHDLFTLANEGVPILPERLLATFALEKNWTQLYHCESAAKGYQPKACEWGFIGPFRPPWELAQLVMREGLFGMLLARCSKHYKTQQLNKNEASGAECGACVEASAELRGRIVGLRWALHILYDPVWGGLETIRREIDRLEREVQNG